MTPDVYAPPKAALVDPLAAKAQRPALIWFTQGLLAIVCVLMAAIFLRGMVRLITEGAPVSAGTVALAITLMCVQFALPAGIFYGLAYRRRWAWYGAMCFAVILLLVQIWSRMHSVQVLQIKPM